MFLGILAFAAFCCAFINGLTSIAGAVLFVLSLIFISSIEGFGSALLMIHIVTLTAFFSFACSAIGAWFYYTKRLYDKEMNIYLGIGALLGGVSGSLLANTLSGEFLQFLFFILALLASISVFFNGGRFQFRSQLSRFWLIPIGVVLGGVGGIFGLGVGFMLLLVMIVLYKVPIKDAIGSTLFCGGVLSVGTLIGKIGVLNIDAFSVVVIMLAGGLGTWTGGMVSVKTRPKSLQFIVSVLLIGVSIRFLLDWIFYT